MMKKELICYRNIEDTCIIDEMQKFFNEKKDCDIYKISSKLVELAGKSGFYGNLFHDYLTLILVNNENAYSIACEMRGKVTGTVNDMAYHDMEVFRKLFSYDLKLIDEKYGVTLMEKIADYTPVSNDSFMYNHRIRDRICELSKELAAAKTVEEFKDILTLFYKTYGVGKLGLHKAFRIDKKGEEIIIEPIKNIRHVKLDDLVGYEIAKKKLTDNTESFLNKKPANNCLLYGDAGTGKSSSIKAIANEYFDRGLRIIEVYKHQFQYLNELIAMIKGRNYRFIIYMDDLSFEEFEIEYKYLKAVIEGGLEKKPENVLIYATSNRRHLIKETVFDKKNLSDDGDIHANDTVQEKLSLVNRFGVTIYFGKPSPKEFAGIVIELAKRNNIDMPEKELLLKANQWEMAHGGLSGRSAQQFIDYLLGGK
ncbi:ATP-binding protein [Butyrivibrio sp. NC3005]|uniref:ATP-binding protein n=1 Tax=Butyrivibrio sp. NC3005 TaxID=1280685 RepID=UPI0012DECBD2